MTANDSEDCLNILDSYFHLMICIRFFIATEFILMTVLLNQKIYLKRVHRKHQGETYDRKLNQPQVKLCKVQERLQEMLALREEMFTIKSDHM